MGGALKSMDAEDMTKTILLPHQLEAKRKMHNGCILKGATGTGKTITALAYYSDAEPGQRLYVITTAKKRDAGDWQAEARLLGIFPEVDSWQNIVKYEDIRNAFFIFDEQRVIGRGTWVKSFLKITKHNNWVILSAFPGDSWLDYIPVFIANNFYKNRSEFIDEHVIYNPFIKYPKVRFFMNTEKLQMLLESILVEMPFGKHTIRHEIDIFCEYNRDAFDVIYKGRWNTEEQRPITDAGELFRLMRKTVNSDPSRIENVRKLLIDHPKMIIFYNFDYELEILRGLKWDQEMTLQDMDQGKTGGSSGPITATAEGLGPTSTIQKIRESFAVAEWNGHKHEAVPETDEWVYLVQYSAGAEGWNCTKTDTVVFYSLTYSYRMFEQAKGRIDRLDTYYRDLYYYILRSSSKIDNGILVSLSKKKNFNENAFLRSAF